MTYEQLIKNKPFKEIIGTHSAEEHKEGIEKILSEYRLDACHMRIIAGFIIYNVADDVYAQFKKYKQIKHPRSFTMGNLIIKYGEAEAHKKYAAFKARCSGNQSLQRMVEKHGEVEGLTKFNKIQQHFDNCGTLEFFVKRHGEIIGTDIYNNKMKQLRFGASREGFIEKYGYNHADTILHERKDNTSLVSFCRRYGDNEGKIKYEAFCERKRRYNTLDSFQQKYGIDEGTRRYYKWATTSAISISGFSPISQKLFKELSSDRKKEDLAHIYYASNNREYLVMADSKCYFYDYVDTICKKAIEFNGDDWHANPAIFSEDDRPSPRDKSVTAKEIWLKDEFKLQVLKNNRGYEVMVVWERDYRKDRQEVVRACREFLNYE